MFVDLLVWAGCVRAAMSPRGPGALAVVAHAWAEAALERERRSTLVTLIGCLPPGFCVAERDACGRVRFIGPAATAPRQAAWDVLG